MNADDLAPMLASTPAADTSLPDFGFHQGLVLAWNSTNGTNRIRVAGSDLNNLPVLSSAGSVSLEPGTVVGILRYHSVYFVLGRVVSPGSGLAQPQQAVVLYPQFAPVHPTAGTSGYHTVSAGTLTAWEGRARPTQPYIEIDGIWGVATGTGSVTYEVWLNSQKYGSKTYTTGPHVERIGPFDIRDRIGQDWLRVQIIITASSGTGEIAFGVLGAYFRQG